MTALRHRPRLTSAIASTPALIAVGVAVTFAVMSVFVIAAGADPIDAFYRFLVQPLTSTSSFLEVLVSATPILFTGAAVAIAFRAGYYNIGAEGQLLAGAIAAAGLGMVVGDLPSFVAWPIMLVGGALAGATWALVPAVLRVRLGIDEVVTTLLMNPVALLLVNALLNGPWRDPVTGFPESALIGVGAQFPPLIERSRLHAGFLIALAIVAVAWFVLTRTPAGLRLRAVGSAPAAASFAGLNVSRTLLRAALFSGAICGIAGVSEVAGIQDRLTGGLSPGFGYTGIVVATLGGLTMPGVTAAALLLGDLRVGASSAGRALGIPSQLGEIVQATLLLVAIAILAVMARRRAMRP
ncbi:MAG: ABC transporter permease [Candidatus Limnocylindrales bacterium]